MCVSACGICVYVFVSMYIYVHGGQRLTSGVFPNLSILNFETTCVSELGVHQCDLTYWPAGPRDPPVLIGQCWAYTLALSCLAFYVVLGI